MPVRSHHIYKSVRSPVIGEQLVLEKEPDGQSKQGICSGSDEGFSDSGPNFVRKFIHRSHGILLHKKGSVIHCLASIILLGEKGKEKAYNYHANINIILDTQKTPRLFETWHLLL